MQRRTNEWYQGLREASSEDDEDEVVVETSFSQLQKSPPTFQASDGISGASNKSPPLSSSGWSKRSPPLWTNVHVESVQGSRSSGSNSSNSELGSVRDRTSSRSPPSGDGTTVLSSSS